MAKLKIELPEEKVKTVFKLKKSSHEILNNYALFLSDLHKKKVSEDIVIDSVLEKLSKDKDFKKFCLSQKKQPVTQTSSQSMNS